MTASMTVLTVITVCVLLLVLAIQFQLRKVTHMMTELLKRDSK